MNLRCPVDGCTNQRTAPRYAMCVACWHLVPVPMRDRIRGYWGEIKRLRNASAIGHRQLLRNAEQGIAEAQAAAVDVVNRQRAERQLAA